MMKGKSVFTRTEADAIISLIRKKVVADTNEQKRLRDKIRAIGFYASDYGIAGGYTEYDFLRVVKIVGSSTTPPIKTMAPGPPLATQYKTPGNNIKKFSFPPISKPDANILILGTMPGERSLALNQYYGHGGNQFWKIMFSCFGMPYSSDYIAKTKLLIENGIALWDVLQHCEREGSADIAIIGEFPNNFKGFFEKHPAVKTILFNGNNAAEYFQKYIAQMDLNTSYYPQLVRLIHGLLRKKK